jgi:hypothetical protein
MNRAVFFDAIRPLFGGLSTDQVRGLEILLAAVDGLPVRHQAYVLATAYHETAATMQPVRETLAKTDAEAARRLERAWKAGKLPWVKTPYWRADNGKYWIGRGYVQLTHKVNYERAGKRMGVDLVADPSAAMSPMLAARIIVQGMSEGWFTGVKMSDCATYRDMRKVVNGMDRADMIAGYAAKFETALLEAERQAPRPDVEPVEAMPEAGSQPGLIAAVVTILAALAAYLGWGK